MGDIWRKNDIMVSKFDIITLDKFLNFLDLSNLFKLKQSKLSKNGDNLNESHT